MKLIPDCLRVRRTVRNWNSSNGVVVHHKWEICWCGAHNCINTHV